MATTTLHSIPITNFTMIKSSLPIHRHLTDPLPHLKELVGLHSLQKNLSVSGQECNTTTSAILDDKSRAEFEAEKEAVKSYEEGLDDYDGPIWRDPLDPRAVATQMKEIRRPPLCFHEECEGWEHWENGNDEDDEAIDQGYEESIGSIEGPVWIDPLDRDAVAKQMCGDSRTENLNIGNDQEESWDPAWFEEQRKPEKQDSIVATEEKETRNPDAWFEGDDETMWEFRPTKKDRATKYLSAPTASTTCDMHSRQQHDCSLGQSSNSHRTGPQRRHSDSLSRNQELFREAAGVEGTENKKKLGVYQDVNRGAW